MNIGWIYKAGEVTELPSLTAVIQKEEAWYVSTCPELGVASQGKTRKESYAMSERAVQVNVAIMRAFVGLRRLLASNEVLARKLAELERRLEGHDHAIKSLFDAIRELAAPPVKPRGEIGFHVKEDSVPYRVRRK